MVELRKRKAPAEPVQTEKKPKVAAKATPKGRSRASEKPVQKTSSTQSPKASVPKVGEVIQLDGFGGEIETHEGAKTTLKALVDASDAGVVLFTYPKASTPGCTKQACLFRDGYSDLTSTGLAIYGLSNDSPKANTTFKTKQNLPYPLLCDKESSLIAAIGLKKVPKGTQRGVFVVDKAGKVLISEPGSPAGTVDAVKALVTSKSSEEESKDSEAKAEGSTVPDKL